VDSSFIGWAIFEISSSRCSTPTSAHKPIFESDDEEDVQVSKRRRILSGSDSEESDEDDGLK